MLQVGDVLTVVNGIALKTTDRDRARELLEAAGDTLQITVAGTVPPHVLEALVSERAQHLSPELGKRHDRVLVWAGRLLRFPLVAVACLLLFFVGIGEGVVRMLVFAVQNRLADGEMHPSPDNWNFEMAMWLWSVAAAGPGNATQRGRRLRPGTGDTTSLPLRLTLFFRFRYQVFLKVDDDGLVDRPAKELDVREWLRIMPTTVRARVAAERMVVLSTVFFWMPFTLAPFLRWTQTTTKRTSPRRACG